MVWTCDCHCLTLRLINPQINNDLFLEFSTTSEQLVAQVLGKKKKKEKGESHA